jgi:hypothetical protein
MGELRITSEMMHKAHRRVSRDAPPPTWRPVNGGLAMAAAFTVPMIIFASPDVGVSLYALVLSAAIGFALGFLPLKRQKDAYDRARNRELEALRGTSDARTPQRQEAPLPRWLTRDGAEPR